VAVNPRSHTGTYLRPLLEREKPQKVSAAG
jgi:hypothetical protein